MKKTYLKILTTIAGISLMLLSSCSFRCEHGSGHQVSETRKLGNFTKIDISGGFKVILKQDSSLAITVSADDNLIKYIKTTVDDNKLRISTGDRNLCNSGEMAITIGVRNIEQIKASGAIDLSSDGKINAKDFQFKLLGATKVNMDIDAANLNTEGSGATEINLKGQASSHNIDLSGGSKIYALDFVVGNYNISTSGASECQINVLHSLNIHTSGASTIKYRGNPSTINNDKSGASSITKIN
jgi:hypothetical protein